MSVGAGTGGLGGVAGTGGSGATSGQGGASTGGAGGLASCITDTIGGHDYAFCDAYVEWTVARDDCVARGMRLVRIDDLTEDDWVAATADGHFPRGSREVMWFGASDLAVEGEWRWVDGAHFWTGDWNGTAIGGLYTNWKNGDPNNLQNAEHCLAAEIGNNPMWIDGDCTMTHRFVCEQY